MGVMTFRPGQRLVIPSLGVRSWSAGLTVAAGNWWDSSGTITSCVAAYQPKGAASLAASYVNLVNPGTNNAAPGTAPAHSPTDGWSFTAGSSQYLTTGLVPSLTWTMIVRFSDCTTNTAVAGSRTGAGANQFSITKISTAMRYSYGNSNNDFAPSATAAVCAIAGANAYRNGVSEGALSGSFILPLLSIYIGALNSAGTAISFSTIKIQAFSVYNATLTGVQVAAVSNAMSAI